MGECKYCHKDAGWLSSAHDECKNKHNQGLRTLRQRLLSCFNSKIDFYTQANELNRIMADSYITGTVCMTDKHIYFSSPEKSIKIAYSSILNVDTYSNGLGLQKDGANSKPIFLEGLDSWFGYNVIANLKD